MSVWTSRAGPAGRTAGTPSVHPGPSDRWGWETGTAGGSTGTCWNQDRQVKMRDRNGWWLNRDLLKPRQTGEDERQARLVAQQGLAETRTGEDKRQGRMVAQHGLAETKIGKDERRTAGGSTGTCWNQDRQMRVRDVWRNKVSSCLSGMGHHFKFCRNYNSMSGTASDLLQKRYHAWLCLSSCFYLCVPALVPLHVLLTLEERVAVFEHLPRLLQHAALQCARQLWDKWRH